MDPRSLVALGRRLQGDTFLDRAVIADRTLTEDGGGGWIETWVDRPKQVRCRYVRRQMGQLTDADPRIGLGEFGFPEGVAALVPIGTDIDEGMRVTNPVTDEKWIVTTASRIPSSALQVSVRVILREMDS